MSQTPDTSRELQNPDSPTQTASAPVTPLSTADEYLIADILPANEVHLVAGPSGSGKTTWLMQFIKTWQRSEPVFGHATFPRPFAYIVLDRSASGMRRTFRRVGVNPKNFPLWTPGRAMRKASLSAILDKVRKSFPDARVLFLEGLASKVPGGKLLDYAVVAGFLTELADYCEDHDVTIIGIVHSSKTKSDAHYENPRQRVMGSVAWAAYSETIIIIEPKNPDNPNDQTRALFLLPRNAKEQLFTMSFEDGLLKLADKGTPMKISNFKRVTAYINALVPNEKDIALFSVEELRQIIDIPESSLFAELNKLKTSKHIENVKAGVYRRLKLYTE